MSQLAHHVKCKTLQSVAGRRITNVPPEDQITDLDRHARRLQEAEDAPPFPCCLGVVAGVEATGGLLVRRACGGGHQRRVRMGGGSRPASFLHGHFFRRMGISVAACHNAARFHALRLAGADGFSQCRRQWHSTGHRGAAPARRCGPFAASVAETCIRQGCADGGGPVVRRLDRA